MSTLSRLSVILALTLILLGMPPASSVTSASSEGALIPPVIAGPDEPSLNYVGCGGDTVPVMNPAYEQQVVELVNAERWEHGQLPPLKRADSLDAAARYFAADLGQDDYFDHATYDRNASSQLVRVCSWTERVSKYYKSAWAENAAAGYATAAGVMAAWMASSGHKANILNTLSWEIGVGYYAGSGSYGVYWIQDYGIRAGVYPLVINREAAQTSSRDVALYINGNWSQMRLKNENGTFTPWQPFQTNSAWNLSACVGTKTVTAELKSSSMTATSSDVIDLTAAPTLLGGLPDEFRFTYSIPDGRLYPATGVFTPLDMADGCSMPWTVSTTGSWFTVSGTSGITPDPITVTPGGFDTQTPGTYTGSLIVNGPPGASGSPHQITLTLVVENQPWNSIYLPLVIR